MKTQRYGWVRDVPDHRDLHYRRTLKQLPSSVDLRSQFPPAYDQGELGSCTANAVAGLVQFDEKKSTLSPPRCDRGCSSTTRNACGYCYMPYLLDPDLAGDFWTVRRVT
jgi:hypothetical protein